MLKLAYQSFTSHKFYQSEYPTQVHFLPGFTVGFNMLGCHFAKLVRVVSREVLAHHSNPCCRPVVPSTNSKEATTSPYGASRRASDQAAVSIFGTLIPDGPVWILPLRQSDWRCASRKIGRMH